MGCKLKDKMLNIAKSKRFNRNIMGCKSDKLKLSGGGGFRFNRNIMGCKYENKRLRDINIRDLIGT